MAYPDQPNTVRLLNANAPTYFATGEGYTAYATPTDMLTLQNSSANVILRVLQCRLLVNETTGTLRTAYFLKRSTLNTGGTLSNPTKIALDSASAASAATLNLYTAAPTTGTLIGNIGIHRFLTTATTAAPATSQLASSYPISFADSWNKPVVLRQNEAFSVNWGGNAIGAGHTSWWDIIWTEETY